MLSQNRIRAHRSTPRALSTLVIAAMVLLGGWTPFAMAADATHPRYTSTGLVAVQAKDVGELQVEQETQAQLLLHPRLLGSVLESSDAIRQTHWFKQFVSIKDGKERVDIAAAKADLHAHLEVLVIPKSRLIQVRMSADDPHDCQTIVREIVEKHIKDQKELASLGAVEQAQALEQLKLNYESQIRDINQRMLRIATDLGALGVGVGPGSDSKNLELQQLIAEQLRTVSAWSEAKAQLKTFDEQMQTNSAPELAESVQKDPACVDYRHRVDDLDDLTIEQLATLGEKDIRTVASERRLDHMKKKLDDAENDVKSRTAEMIRARLVNAATLSDAARKRIDDRIDEVRVQLASLAKMKNEYEHLQRDITAIRGKLDKTIDEQDRIGFLYSGGSSPVRWAELPDLPDVKGGD
jgi:hypothetical protein